MDLKFTIVDGELVFNDDKLNNFLLFIDNKCDDLSAMIRDFTNLDLQHFLKYEFKRFFICDPGSGESDFEAEFYFVENESDISNQLSKMTIYNIDNVKIYDLETGDIFKVKQEFSLYK